MLLSEIWRYPVKSLSGEALDRVVLNPGLGLPHDRRWALARPKGKATAGGEWHPKSQFFVLAQNVALSGLTTTFDAMSGEFSLHGPDGIAAQGNLSSAQDRALIEAAIASHLGLTPEQAPTIVEAKDLGYFDATEGPVSMLNMNSLRALEDAMGITVDPARFRMNFHVEGLDPWVEHDWPGKKVQVGKSVLQITEITGRCKATHVNPTTATLDLDILHALKDNFGHTQLGVYGEIAQGGLVQSGDVIKVLD